MLVVHCYCWKERLAVSCYPVGFSWGISALLTQHYIMKTLYCSILSCQVTGGKWDSK